MSATRLEKSGPLFFILSLVAIVVVAVWNAKATAEADEVIAETNEPETEEAVVQSIYNLANSTSASIAAGKATYDLTCAVCHGASGDGKGPAGAASTPPARDFTTLLGYTFGISAEKIYSTIDKGSPGTSMASFSYMSEDEKISLTHYVRSFMPLNDAAAVAAAAKIYGSEAPVSNKEPVFDVTTAVFTDEKIAKATESRTVNTENSELMKPMSKVDKLKMIYSASLKRVDVGPYSKLIVNTKDYNLNNTLSSFNSFKTFVLSDSFFGITGESFQTLSNDDLLSIYQSLK